MIKKTAFLVVAVCALTFIGCDYQQHPEQGSDKVISAVLNYNKQIYPVKGNDDQEYITLKGDSDLQAFIKQVEKKPFIDDEIEVGVRYTSRQNGWSYYVYREDKDIYSAIYCTAAGKPTSVKYRVNFASGFIQASRF